MEAEQQDAVRTTARDEMPSSIELKMSAKGERYWDVKIYHRPGEHLLAIEQLRETDTRLRELYGQPS
jgi:hypothetical protein